MSDPLGIKAYLAMAKLVGILILIGIVSYQSSQIHKWHTQADKQAAARAADRASYEAAQKQADLNNQAKVQKIEAQHEAVTTRIKSDYSRDLDRLRSQSRTPQGAAGGSKAPGVPHAAPGTPPEVVSLPPAELLRAQELELRLNALIDWVNEQLKVER